MPRCCDLGAQDLAPCYASVLVVGGAATALDAAIEDVESCAPICPLVTAWCPSCSRVSMVTSHARCFPSSSAYYAHQLVLHARLEETFRALGRE